MSDAPPALAVRDLRVQRGARQILHVPSLTIATGDRLAVIGPNGAGKSTLLEALALLRRPTTGEICFAGAPVRWRPAELVRLRRRMAVVFQRPLLLAGTLQDNVALGLRLRGARPVAADAEALRWLDRLGVAHLADRVESAVSVGEAQRASIARALALAPEVLLLDEPFAALDSLARQALLNDLSALLGDTRCAVVLVTHDWREVRRLARRVVALFDGQVAQQGAMDEVEAAPATARVAALIAAGS